MRNKIGEIPVPPKERERVIKEMSAAQLLTNSFGSDIVSRVEDTVSGSSDIRHRVFLKGGEMALAHGRSFIEEVIPQKIAELRQRGEDRKLRVLDSGSGVGIFADQIESSFPSDVKVWGTTFNEEKDKGKVISDINDDFPSSVFTQEAIDLKKDIVNKVAKPKFKKEHRIRKSVLLLDESKGKFDLIIDTYGEAYYSMRADEQDNGSKSKPDFKRFHIYLKKILSLLNSGGDFYLSTLGEKRGIFYDNGSVKKGNYFADEFIENLDEFQSTNGVVVYFEGDYSLDDLRHKLGIQDNVKLNTDVLTSYIKSHLRNLDKNDPDFIKLQRIADSKCSLNRLRIHKI